MKNKDVYSSEKILKYITEKRKEFEEIELKDNNVNLNQIALLYRVKITQDDSREEIALKIAHKLLDHKEKTNEIENRAASYFARELLLPNEVLELAIEKYEKDFNVEDFSKVSVVDFLDELSKTLNVSKDLIENKLRFLNIIYTSVDK